MCCIIYHFVHGTRYTLFSAYRITGVKCAAHSIDLAIKDICKQDWAAELVKSVREAVIFLKRHQKLLAIVKKKSPTRGLLLPNDTRFGTSVIMTNRFLDMKSALKNTVVDEEYRAYLDDSSVKLATRNLGKRIRDFILNDEMEEGACWFEVEFFLAATMPFFELVRLADGIKPQAAQLYKKLRGALDGLEARFDSTRAWAGIRDRLPKIQEVLRKRRIYMKYPVYGAAFALSPAYQKECLADYDGNGPVEDVRIMSQRLLLDLGDSRSTAMAAIEEASELPGGGPVGKAMAQLARFRSGNFSGKIDLGSARTVSGQAWWHTLGRPGLDELATVACYVLSMIPAAAGCERNWSLLGSITGGKHARLSSEKAAKLVYVRANQHLLHREFHKGQEDYEAEGFGGESDDDIIPSESESEIESESEEDMEDD